MAKKKEFRVLTGILVLIFFQLTFAPYSSGALYDKDPAAQSIWNSAGDPDGEGRGMTQAFWTSAGTFYFLQIDLFEPVDNNRIYGVYFDNGRYTPTSATDFSSDKAAYILKWKTVVPKGFTGGPETRWGETSDVAENVQDIMEPIPSLAWLLALGVIGLVALKRRKRRGYVRREN